jgi:broad specificity phosphatase PhoE
MAHQPETRWPERLWIVRHGESAGNVARHQADAAGLQRIPLSTRDVDVPLSPVGEEQARGLGRWFARGAADGRPDVLLCSPYLRARDTARLFREAGGCDPDEPVCLDERLREKEFGILDGLTTSGLAALEPDVIFRLRSLLDTVGLHHGGRRVMIVAHQVVVLCLRYVLEGMSEEQVLAVDRAGDVANCSVTEYRFNRTAARDGKLVLVRYNETAPVEESAAPVTDAPDKMVAARG